MNFEGRFDNGKTAFSVDLKENQSGSTTSQRQSIREAADGL